MARNIFSLMHLSNESKNNGKRTENGAEKMDNGANTMENDTGTIGSKAITEEMPA